jgi:Flp pilus assembly protein TadD
VPSTASDHHRARARLLEGRALLALGDTKGALAAIGDSVRMRPEVSALLWLGEAQLASGDKAAAVATAHRVLDAVPDESHALELIDRAEGRSDDDDDTDAPPPAGKG